MKKLCHKKAVHPSPHTVSDQLALLPAAILTLSAALSSQDKEVLAYLLSSPGSFSAAQGGRKPSQKSNRGGRNRSGGHHHHPPLFHCPCFSCYTSYWVRWDASCNRQLIHEIIDGYESSLTSNDGCRSKKGKSRRGSAAGRPSSLEELAVCGGDGDLAEGGDTMAAADKGTVRRLVGFIGEKIWKAWS